MDKQESYVETCPGCGVWLSMECYRGCSCRDKHSKPSNEADLTIDWNIEGIVR